MKRFNPKHNTSAKNSSSSKNDIVHSADKIKTLSSLWQENKQNILRKIYQILRRHRFWIRVIISLCCVVGFLTLSSLSYKTGFHQGVEQWSELTSRLHQFKQLQEVTLKENLQLKKQLSGLEQQHTIREIEYQKLSSEMKDLLNKNAELREDNALYQSVMGKPSSKNGLGIQRLQLYATQSPNIFQYQLMLISNLANRKLLEGTVQIAVSGKIGLKDISLPLQQIVSAPNSLALDFKFKNYQELTGEILLPNSFEPKAVIVQVEPKKYTKLKNRQVFPWWLESQQG